jgi:hypothetical protein
MLCNVTAVARLCQYVCRMVSAQLDRPSPRKPLVETSRVPFIFVSSAPFSGSTLFSLLAGSHPCISTVGEMTGPTPRQDPDKYICSCGNLIRRCGFWNEVVLRFQSKGIPFDPGSFGTRIHLAHSRIGERILTGSLGSSRLEAMRDVLVGLVPSIRRRLQGRLARNRELAATVLEISGKTHFLDASKNHMRIRYLSRDPHLDFYVVHLVRDVRGASLSRRKNQQIHDWTKAIGLWQRANANIERQIMHVPAHRRLLIRYEDLCRNTHQTLDAFYRFCGLAPHLLPHELGEVPHHLIGNRMRLSISGKPRLDEEWRRVLTVSEVSEADRLAGAMHVRYGYPPMASADLSPP